MNEPSGRVACLLAAAALIGLPATADAKERKREFDAKALHQVEIQLSDADLKVLTHDAARVEVSSSATELCAEQRGEVLHIDDKQVPKQQHTEVTVRLPAALQLKLVVLSGDIVVEGVQGRLEIKAISGDVRVRDSGPLKIKAVSGDVEVTGASGTVKVAMVSGSVRIKQVRGELLKVKSVSGEVWIEGADMAEVELHTFSGDVRFEGRLPPGGELEAEAFSGNITLRLPADQGYDLDARSGSGDVRVGSRLQQRARRDRYVRVKSYSGEVTIEAIE